MRWFGNALVDLLAGLVMMVLTCVIHIIFAFGLSIFLVLFLVNECYGAVRKKITRKNRT
ncbi:hypothetical protein LCGC14_1004280 [marine sediment metagenome]|uniref:Uncharacterized protein n=1 Tax=marine sediment metagenome TaxID=412755 RepID=A0A0F9QKH5_9ZZZZ